MKKFMMVLFLVTFITGMFAAADFTWNGGVRMRTSLNDLTMLNQPANHWTDMRVRFGFESKISEELMFTSQFEIGDIKLGTEGAGIGTDGINIETKHAYLTLNSEMIPAEIQAGLLYWYDNADGLIVDDDIAGMFFMPKMIKGLTLGYLVPVDEGHNDDNIFFADMGMEMNDMMSFGGSVIFDYDRITRTAEGDATYKAYFTGRATVSPMENASIALVAVYNMNKTAADETGGAFAVSVKPSFTLNNITIDGTVLFVSGNDKGEAENVFTPISHYYINGLEIYGNGVNDRENCAYVNNDTDYIGSDITELGALQGVLKVSYKMSDMMNFWGAFGYISTIEGDETMVGMEFDLGTEIMLTKDLSWSFVGAMAMPNKDFGAGEENMYAINSALTFKLK